MLAEAVVAAEDVPPFANTAVDGYAVRAADVAAAPVELHVVGEVAAGASTDRVLGAGRGDPDHDRRADAGRRRRRRDGRGHRARRRRRRVLISKAVAAGAVRARRRRRRARSAPSSSPPAPSCARRSPACWPASTPDVCACIRTPRVGVLSTGDELVDDGSPLRPGQIRESNRTMLLAAGRRGRVRGVDLGVVRDDEAALEATVCATRPRRATPSSPAAA